MKLLCLLTSLLLVGTSTLSVADEAKAKATSEWTTIFDGTSLDGWKSNEEVAGCFTIEDGKLKVSGGRAHLFYVGADGKAEFTNFELKLRVMTEANANSGVYLHTAYQEKGWPDKGYEAQVNATHKDAKKTGSLYGVSNIYVDPSDKDHAVGTTFLDEKTGENQVRATAPNKDGEWFDYHIIVNGKTIELRVNGKTTVRYTEPADGSLPNAKMPGRKLSSGTIGIQGHDPKSTIYFEKIQVKRLP